MNKVDIKTVIQNGNDPVYPQPFASDAAGNMYHVGEKDRTASGLTKREMFAMAAMQGIVSGFDPESKTHGCYIPYCDYPGLMSQAVQLADELLKQLES